MNSKITLETLANLKAQIKRDEEIYNSKISKIEADLEDLQRSIPDIKLNHLERIRHQLIAIANQIQREFEEIDKDFEDEK